MDKEAFVILQLLLTGSDRERMYIRDNVKPVFYEDECLSLIHEAALRHSTDDRGFNLYAMCSELLDPNDKIQFEQTKRALVTYFRRHPEAADCGEDNLKGQLYYLLGEIISAAPRLLETVESIVGRFIDSFLHRELRMVSGALEVNSLTIEEAIAQLRELDAIGRSLSRWEEYVCDIESLCAAEEQCALVEREGVGYFFREEIYLISGLAGSMKSLFSLNIAAAALNNGLGAPKTLGFYATQDNLKVLYVDTELSKNTIRNRMNILRGITDDRCLDSSRFKYVSLRQTGESIGNKLKIFSSACLSFHPDVIILDSIRDLCQDFNDIKEAENLIIKIRDIASQLNAVFITTTHKSIVMGNSKGHLGMRLNEACSIEFSLQSKKETSTKYTEVTFSKERDGVHQPFAYSFNEEDACLQEVDIDFKGSANSSQLENAEALVREVLKPGMSLRYGEVVSLMMDSGKVCETTAKHYISVLCGSVITRNNKLYSLAPEREQKSQMAEANG